MSVGRSVGRPHVSQMEHSFISYLTYFLSCSPTDASVMPGSANPWATELKVRQTRRQSSSGGSSTATTATNASSEAAGDFSAAAATERKRAPNRGKDHGQVSPSRKSPKPDAGATTADCSKTEKPAAVRPSTTSRSPVETAARPDGEKAASPARKKKPKDPNAKGKIVVKKKKKKLPPAEDRSDDPSPKKDEREGRTETPTKKPPSPAQHETKSPPKKKAIPASKAPEQKDGADDDDEQSKLYATARNQLRQTNPFKKKDAAKEEQTAKSSNKGRLNVPPLFFFDGKMCELAQCPLLLLLSQSVS